MPLFGKSSIESKRLSLLVDKICSELQIDKPVALHFINSQLEQLYDTKIHIRDIQLTQLENELNKHIKTETELKEIFEEKQTMINNAITSIEKLSSSITEKTNFLETKKQKLLELENLLNQLNNTIRENEKQIKQTDYDLMMGTHSNRDGNDKTQKYIKIFLTVITIIALIIASILIYKK